MKYKATIYKITCSHCDKIYIGCTKDKKGINNRFSNHKSDCNKGRTSKIYCHMREQGFDKFKIETIEIIEIENNREQRQKENEKIIEYDSIVSGLNTFQAYLSDTIRKQRQKERSVGYGRKYRQKNRKILNKKRYDRRKKQPKDKYKCECCNYQTNRSDTYGRHLRSKIHKKKMLI